MVQFIVEERAASAKVVQAALSSARSFPGIKKAGEEPVTGTGVKSLQPKVKAINASAIHRGSNRCHWSFSKDSRTNTPGNGCCMNDCLNPYTLI
jgi:hypothetical protein